MTAIEFIALCESVGVDPQIALENENLREALRNKDDARIAEILKEEF
jgi:hypothetical protein